MKELTAIIIALALCTASLFLMMSCGGDTAETTGEQTTADSVTTADAGTTAEEQTEANADTAAAEEQTEAETEAEKEVEYEENTVPLFATTSGHTPISAADGLELACKFTLEEGELLTGLQFESIPSWSTNGESGFIVELYKWDNDYENTIVGDALYSEEFSEWIDNSPCVVDFTDAAENGFSYSSYMWVFKGTTPNIGIWAMDPVEECEYFESGVPAQHGFRVNAIVLSPVE